MPIPKGWWLSGAYASPRAMIQMLGTYSEVGRAGPLDSLWRTVLGSHFCSMHELLLIIFLRQSGSPSHLGSVPRSELELF